MARTLHNPFQVGDNGLPRAAAGDLLIRQQLEQLLFTAPGERLHRPDFGCGVQQLVFSGASPESAAAAEYVIRLGIRRELSSLLSLDAVRVWTEDAALIIDILYTVRLTGEELAATFRRPLEAPP